MKRRTKFVLAGAMAAAAVGGSAAAVAANNAGDDDASDTPISQPALDRATHAALEHIGGGRVTGTEVGDEESYYEVEVTTDDGSQVDVQLDESFNVVGSEKDQGEHEGGK